MSLQSHKADVLIEVRSGHLDPGEEARLRGFVQFVEEVEPVTGRRGYVVPLPVELVPASDEEDGLIPENPDSSAVA